MKKLWNWLVSLFSHKPVPVPAPKKPGVPVSVVSAPPSGVTPSAPPPPAPSVPVSAPVTNAPPPSPPAPIVPVSVVPIPAPVPVPPSPVPAPAPVPVPPAPVPQPTPVPPAVAPTFLDTFSTGQLNPAWQISTYPEANYGGAGSNMQFAANMVDLSQGCLCLKLSQPTSGTSTGAELELNQKFGYGTYEWVFRAGSTSKTPTGQGSRVSGGVSSPFILLYENGESVTEIDCPEVEGQNGKIGYDVWKDNKGLGAEMYPSTDTFDPSSAFHTYRTVWQPGSIQFFIDGVLQGSVTGSQVPTQPASPIMNHYGTNSSSWGGTATVGVDRYAYIKSFSFTPAS